MVTRAWETNGVKMSRRDSGKNGIFHWWKSHNNIRKMLTKSKAEVIPWRNQHSYKYVWDGTSESFFTETRLIGRMIGARSCKEKGDSFAVGITQGWKRIVMSGRPERIEAERFHFGTALLECCGRSVQKSAGSIQLLSLASNDFILILRNAPPAEKLF